MSSDKIGDDPAAVDALDAVANARNESYLMQDARGCIEDGVLPDELPRTREYRWPYPSKRPDGGKRSYKSALRYVLEQYYEENGYPDENEESDN